MQQQINRSRVCSSRSSPSYRLSTIISDDYQEFVMETITSKSLWLGMLVHRDANQACDQNVSTSDQIFKQNANREERVPFIPYNIKQSSNQFSTHNSARFHILLLKYRTILGSSMMINNYHVIIAEPFYDEFPVNHSMLTKCSTNSESSLFSTAYVNLQCQRIKCVSIMS